MLLWHLDNVPWDFSAPDGYLFNTTLNESFVGKRMWRALLKGRASVFFFG